MGSKYASTSVTGYNASPPADDGTQVSTNQIKWSTIKDKLGDPLNTFAAALDTALVTAFDQSARSVTTTSSTLSSDHNRTIEIASTVTTTISINLGDAVTMAAGYTVGIVNRSGIAQTIGRVTSADTINGVASNKSIPSLAAIRLMVNSQANGYTIIGQAQDSFPSTSAAASSAARTQWRTSFAAFNTSLTSAVAGWIGDGGWYQVNANSNTYNAASHYVEFTANGSVRPDTGLYYNLGGTPTFATAFKASADPTVVVRVCAVGASATDRFIGLSGAQITTGAPTNGIYFRFNTSGNYVFVCRASGTESTVDTGTAATAGTFVNLKWVSSANGTSIQAYVNDVAAGAPITTNIPSAALGFSATFSTTTNAVGYRLADVFIEQDME